MIEYKLDKKTLILHIKPLKRLEEADFLELSKEIDPIIDEKGYLSGIILETDHLPCWKNFSTMLEHMRFIKHHHRKINKIALVTDSRLLELGKMVAENLVKPKFQQFPAGHVAMAKSWIKEK